MSHHLDSPASRRDGRLNVTDVYLFHGQDSTVLVTVNSSLAGTARTPGFHPEGRYAPGPPRRPLGRGTGATPAPTPADDPAYDGERIAELVAAAARPTGASDPAAYGRAVAARLLPDLLPYRVDTPAWSSIAGFNARALADNALEVVFGLVTSSAVPTGLTAAAAPAAHQENFPDVVLVG